MTAFHTTKVATVSFVHGVILYDVGVKKRYYTGFHEILRTANR